MPTAADVVIPSGALVALVVLSLIEVALVVFCIIDIVRRPAVLGGHKWVWIVIVVLFNLIGSVIYLAIGRVRQQQPEARREPDAAGGRVAAAADILYGPASGTDASDAGGPPPSSPGAGEDS